MSKKFAAASKKPLSSARSGPPPGRPTREQAEKRHAELLDRALDVFLKYGFELATMEEITGLIGMHKSTVYSLYADKQALFRAAVERAILRGKLPMDALVAADQADPEATLIAFARLLLANSTTTLALKLQRIIIAESFRTPDITATFWEQGPRASVEFLTDWFGRRAARGELVADQPELVAHGFLTLTVGLMARMILVGTKLSQREIDQRIKLYVRMFLNGILPTRT